jgi:hypothetical protein
MVDGSTEEAGAGSSIPRNTIFSENMSGTVSRFISLVHTPTSL